MPESALFRHEGEWAVFVVEDGVLSRRTVAVGHRGGLKAQVLEGLREGKRVVTHPANELAPGTRVRARNGGGGTGD